ncbi:hypothetical protein ARMGADRAFT_1090625 [Armillaria gallica]|uniref:Uncharacterized protein n=1 Tax=Armillaria gallica TaxID=47427 RepID=A0A2H3CG76_ARMGA|nr:hypothetical protein ARMGADRAFT_1090625 [Armillaria gallica]
MRKETPDLNIALDFDLDLESGQIVVLIHADLASCVGIDCTFFFLSALRTLYEGHAAEYWLTPWRDQLGSSCASSTLLPFLVSFDYLSPVRFIDLATEPPEVELLKQQLEEQEEVSKLAHDALYDAVQQKAHYQEQLYHHRREIVTIRKKLIEAGNSIYTPLEQINYYVIARISQMYNLEQCFFVTPSGR